MLTAKTRKAYFANMAAIGVIMFTLMTLFAQSSLMPTAEEWRQHKAAAPTPSETFSPNEVFSKIPTPVIVVAAIAAVIWIGGGNWIMVRQARRAGRPWWDSFNPLTPPGRNMDRRAWLQLALLVFLGFAVFSVGMNLVQPAPQPAVSAPPQN